MTGQLMTKGEQTQAAIVEAAHILFAKQGYHGTSMRQIAAEAEIALGGIYNHFESKEAIFETVLIEYHPIEEVFQQIQAAPGETVPELVHHAANTIHETLSIRGEYINLVLIELVEFQARHFDRLMNKLFPRALELAGYVFKHRGELRTKNIPLMMFAFMTLTFITFFARRFLKSKTFGKFFQLDLDQIIDIFLYGIMKDPPEAEA